MRPMRYGLVFCFLWVGCVFFALPDTPRPDQFLKGSGSGLLGLDGRAWGGFDARIFRAHQSQESTVLNDSDVFLARTFSII